MTPVFRLKVTKRGAFGSKWSLKGHNSPRDDVRISCENVILCASRSMPVGWRRPELRRRFVALANSRPLSGRSSDGDLARCTRDSRSNCLCIYFAVDVDETALT